MAPPSLMGTSPGVRISPLTQGRKQPGEPTGPLGIGPCSYDPKVVNYSPKYSIREKRTKSVAPVIPGPGDYRTEEAASYLFPSLSVSIGDAKDTRKDIGGDIPGPGAYNPKRPEIVHTLKLVSRSYTR